MAKILVTGATGNVGLATLHALQERLQPSVQVLAGVRHQPPPATFPSGLPLTIVPFDLTKPETYASAISQVDSLFLLLPPGLPNGVEYFGQLLREAKSHGVKHVVYL